MLHQNRRSVHSQLQSNISLQESPIHAPSLYDSDHSPQPYFYPTSFQPKIPKVPRQVDLKVTITNLLSQLKEWLIELCLTENCMAEVNQQLQPIIEQMIDNVQQEESYWIDPYNYHKNGQRRSFNDSDNVVISNQVSEAQQCSVITLDSKTEVALLGEADKNLVQIFFKRYYRLFENCLNRIKRFSGEKKLKFLVDTTVRNIFSQTLRVSYDLKLIEHKISQQKKIKADLNRIGYINLLANRITMILHDKGNIRYALKCMKTSYSDEFKKDTQLVGAMMKKITKLCTLYDKNKRWAMTHHLYSWRQRSLELKISQQQALIKLVRTSIQDILPSLAPTTILEDFKYNWRSAIYTQLNLLIDTLFAGEDCLFISMENIMQTNRVERNTSLVQLLQEQEHLCVTHRTYQWKEHPFLNQFTIEELKSCIISGEIYKSDRNNSSLLLIPIKPTPGIIFASLSNQTHSSLSFSKSPMNLRSFRMLLRLVELITPLLSDLADVCKKVELQWQEMDRNNHYQMLFKQFVKSDLLESIKNGHLQVSERGQQGLQIDSHRLQSPSTVISSVMDKLSISTLMIYHNVKPSVIRELPCVTIGESDAARTQKHIIQSIYTELLNSGKEIMTITRNGKTFTILPLKKNAEVVGMIHCDSIREGGIDYNVVCECLVPLIMKHEGAMQCLECQVKVTVPQEQHVANPKVEKKRRLPYEEAVDLIVAQNIYQLQNKLKFLLQKQGHFFQKLIFRLDLSDPSTYYYFDQSEQSQILTLSTSQQIYHSDIFIEQNYSLTAAGPLSKLVHTFPSFNNPQIHIYELQATHCFRIIGIPIKKDKSIFGYWLVGHYLKDQSEENQGILEWTKDIGGYLPMNNLFRAKKIDSEEMMKELTLRSQEEDLKQRQASQKIKGWKFSGKLCDKIQQLSEVLSLTNSALKSTLLKLESSNELSLIHTSHISQISQKIITLTPELIQYFKDINLVSSHERLYSQTCNLSKRSQHRTIRPLKCQKLHNSFIFLPQMKKESKIKLLSHIKEKNHLQGWISTQYLSFLDEIKAWMWGQDWRQEELTFLMNVGTHQDVSYYFMLNIPFKQNDSQPLTDNFLAHLQQKCSHIISQSFQNTPTSRIKHAAITSLSKLLRGNLTQKYCVYQFRSHLQTSKSKLTQLICSVSKILSPECSKQRRYFQLLDSAFSHIQNKSKQIKDRYVRFCLMSVGLIEGAWRRSVSIVGFESIYSSIRQPCRLDYLRSCTKIITTVSKLQTKLINPIFNLIRTHSNFKATNSRHSKILSVQKLAHITKIKCHKLTLRFFQQIAKFSQQFQITLKLICQQFQKLSFSSREHFLKFSNQRFQTIFNHYQFGLISKIEIMCGIEITKRNVIYKIGSENRLEEFIENEIDEVNRDGIVRLSVQTKLRKYGHYLIAKISTKNDCRATKETKIVLDAIEKALVPCYSNYLRTIQNKADKFCSLLLRITCKQAWNGSCSQPQKIYAFHPDKCIEQQCLKLKFINSLKSLKQAHQISQTKLISAAINQESKIYYNLQYEYNAISAILAGKKQNQSEQFSQIVEKYGQIVTRDQLAKLREDLQVLQRQQQKRMLQYQIKSKTFATSQILTFLEKRNNNYVQNTSYRYLSNQNKENRSNNNSNLSHIERAYVDQKIELAAVKNQINEAKIKEKRIAARSIWLTVSRMLRTQKQKEVAKVFDTLLLPKQNKVRNRF